MMQDCCLFGVAMAADHNCQDESFRIVATGIIPGDVDTKVCDDKHDALACGCSLCVMKQNKAGALLNSSCWKDTQSTMASGPTAGSSSSCKSDDDDDDDDMMMMMAWRTIP